MRLPGVTPAAVLVPLFEAQGDVRVWLLRRPADLRSHAGQVALPGGKTDPTDATPVETALREAERRSACRARRWKCSRLLTNMSP
ncbi:MAG: CoA pyrophosphatase [Polyangiaceae bacterium]